MTLFKDRTLIAAIFISIFWHFLCIFSFNPVLSTGNIREYKTSISFLGDILGNVIPGNEKPFTPSSVSPEHRMDKTEPIEAGFINTQPEKKEFSYSLNNRSSLKLNAYRKKETARVNFYDFFIKGDAKDRIIVYKPDLDKVAMLPSDFINSDFSASIRFRISKDGFIKYAECVTSSGFSEIDQAAIRYVREWQFVPNPKDDQEGIVRVSFK
ncbi:MAG: energy transducer TonB [Candidatus Omnitrophota bacterium]|nr:energy transducer TonB [Candidatus Omnitrophota bacterium]